MKHKLNSFSGAFEGTTKGLEGIAKALKREEPTPPGPYVPTSFPYYIKFNGGNNNMIDQVYGGEPVIWKVNSLELNDYVANTDFGPIGNGNISNSFMYYGYFHYIMYDPFSHDEEPYITYREQMRNGTFTERTPELRINNFQIVSYDPQFFIPEFCDGSEF